MTRWDGFARGRMWPGSRRAFGTGCRLLRGLGPLYLRNAWVQINRLVLYRAGCVRTLDLASFGWGCQKAMARQIRKQGANHGLRVRTHHKGLHNHPEHSFPVERIEDYNCIRTGHAAHNMAIPSAGIANQRLAAAWNKDYLCRLTGNAP